MTQYNISSNYSDRLNDELLKSFANFYKKYTFAKPVYIWILSVVEVPIMLLTLFALCFLIKSRHAASVYVTHLILSDLIQIICLILSTVLTNPLLWDVYHYSLIVGVYFMACIAFERYLLVSHPIWYRTHHSLKFSCFISLIIWFVPLIFVEIDPPYLNFGPLSISIALSIPYPIIILCFVGTWRGLYHSISLTSHKRKLILGSLLLVLLNYTFIVLPQTIIGYFFTSSFKMNILFYKVHFFLHCLLHLNPLADCLLYLFMRTDASDIMKSLYCCCRSDLHQNSVQYTTSTNTQHDNEQ